MGGLIFIVITRECSDAVHLSNQSVRKRLAIVFCELRKCSISGLVNPIKIHTSYKISDFITKASYGEHTTNTLKTSLVNDWLGQKLILHQ